MVNTGPGKCIPQHGGCSLHLSLTQYLLWIKLQNRNWNPFMQIKWWKWVAFLVVCASFTWGKWRSFCLMKQNTRITSHWRVSISNSYAILHNFSWWLQILSSVFESLTIFYLSMLAKCAKRNKLNFSATPFCLNWYT